jgi:pyruvate/2-oxoglutarate/acetoin dehydrogenase E1 component
MFKNSLYHSTVKEEMEKLAENPKVIFLGQQVASENFYGTLSDVSKDIRVEMPVAEEMQLGLCTGLALEGFLPICIYQRCDFIPRAFDQLVNHLNLISKLSRGLFNPKVIIRTTIGSTKPLDVGLQHNKDLTELFKKSVDFPVIKVSTPEEVHSAYEKARTIDTSILIIEEQDLYSE